MRTPRNTPKHPGAMTPAEQTRKRTETAVEIITAVFVAITTTATMILLYTITH